MYGCKGGQNDKGDGYKEFFTCRSPSLVNGKYVAYLIVGKDRFGTFEGKRRYNEFFLIRKYLITNWPGIYVPAVPEKKAFGNLEMAYILERRYFLERFLKQISESEFLVNSDVFRVFTRPEFTGGSADIERQLERTTSPDPEQMLKNYKVAFPYVHFIVVCFIVCVGLDRNCFL